MNKSHIITIIMISVIIIFQLMIIGILTSQEEYKPAYAESEDVNITGVYFPGESYCVYLDGRNREAIQTTEYHEACHFLIDQDYEHFCGEP